MNSDGKNGRKPNKIGKGRNLGKVKEGIMCAGVRLREFPAGSVHNERVFAFFFVRFIHRWANALWNLDRLILWMRLPNAHTVYSAWCMRTAYVFFLCRKFQWHYRRPLRSVQIKGVPLSFLYSRLTVGLSFIKIVRLNF